MIKGIIFDLWNTLISSPLAENSLERIIEILNLSGKKEFWANFGLVSVKPIETFEEVIKEFCKATGNEDKFKKIQKILNKIEERIVVFDDTLPTLSLLKKNGFPLCLITNTDKPSFLMALKKLNVNTIFDFVITSFDVGILKPDKRIFLLATEKLKLKPSECMMVGDSIEEDILTPRKLGMVTVLIDRKNCYKKVPQGANYLIKSLFELKEILNLDK
jgi:HAD superfamily hydrolase (TIGR01549 family)